MAAPAYSPADRAAAEFWMDRALQLARQGEALASPNPMVGAVLVRDGQIVGEGFHTYDARRHAEVIALAVAGGAARGATLYINLEPCCHTGRTAPCTEALLAAGVHRVVAAMADPNPAVSGRGFAQLRAAGVEGETGVRQEQARRLNEGFARWITARRPLLTLKSALTLDGQIVLPDRADKSRRARRVTWITSEESREEVQRMRHATDALLTGIGTILADDPRLTDRTGRPRRRRLLRVVMDSRLRLPVKSRLVKEAEGDVLVFTRQAPDTPRARALRRAGVEVVRLRARGNGPDLVAAVEELGRREILTVLLEAGGTLNWAALAAGIVDKMFLFYAPKVAGSELMPVLRAPGGKPRAMRAQSAFPALRSLTAYRFGPDLAVEGYLRDVYRDH